ncbi:MAG: uracil-DNA glycosylase family protein [Sphingomicrobium sp.]
MGAEGITINRQDAARLLQWWMESGVDTIVDDQPRQWLATPRVVAESAPQPPVAVTPPAPIPADFESFRSWLGETKELPLDRPGARRILPRGGVGAPIMLLADIPGTDDGDRPIGGEAWELAVRMLAAIGIKAEEAYLASLSCMAAPGARLNDHEAARCAEIARHHVALGAPKRLILLGDGPAKALLNAPTSKARGKIHRIEGVRTIATFAPSWLLKRPAEKALAWRDLLLLMEEE